jgi:predicted DCC family thiol-disulfide oxidoreductase YuxK
MTQGATASELELSHQTGGRPLMLYDGLCGFCNTSVRWVARRDRADRFRFAPQQSPLAAATLSRHGIDREAMLKNNSVYLVLDAGSHRERLLTQSDVAVNILLALGGRWRIVRPQCGIPVDRRQPLSPVGSLGGLPSALGGGKDEVSWLKIP